MAFKLKGFTPFTSVGPVGIGFRGSSSRFRTPSSVKWEIDRKRRNKAEDDKKWAEYKEKRKKKKAERKAKRAARKAKKSSPFKKKTYLGKPIKRTLNPFDKHHRPTNQFGYKPRKIKIVKNRPQEGGAGGGPKNMEMWAKRNRG